MSPRYLLSCSFPTELPTTLLDRLVGGVPDPGRTTEWVTTRGWVLWGEEAERAYGRLAEEPLVWNVSMDCWPELRLV